MFLSNVIGPMAIELGLHQILTLPDSFFLYDKAFFQAGSKLVGQLKVHLCSKVVLVKVAASVLW